MRISFFFASLLVFFAVSCSKPASDRLEQAADRRSEMEPGMPTAGVPTAAMREKKADADEEQGQGLGPVALVAPVNAADRMLEYHVDVVYRSTELLAGRDRLFSIASRRGFLRSSHASSQSSSMQLQMAVRSSELYETLKELDQLGELITENITVTDHTENNFAQSLKSKREELRMARRGGALTGDAAVKNWTEREAQLQQSEDASDASQLEKWRIQDRVKYATVVVSLRGPALPEAIQVPVYRNAFTGLLNLFLSFVYYLIYLLPFLFVLALLIRYRRAIKNLLGMGKKPAL